MKLLDDPAYPRIARHLERMGVGALSLYRAPCLERRLAARLRARRQCDLSDYVRLLDADPAERARLVSALAIGVTSFFRNPAAWRRLGAAIDGFSPRSSLRAWSAGCASGEEAYSLAMLLEGVGRVGTGAMLGDWSIDATDIDERSLSVAASGVYSAKVVGQIEGLGPARGALHDGSFVVDPTLRARIRWVRDDLTVGHSRGPYDVVVCRNVLIYFGVEGQGRALRALAAALAPGGLLLLGRTELAAAPAFAGLEAVDTRQRLFRRAE